MKKNNFKIIKLDKSKSLFNYEKKVIISELILKPLIVATRSFNEQYAELNMDYLDFCY